MFLAKNNESNNNNNKIRFKSFFLKKFSLNKIEIENINNLYFLN